jgi:hypothetical protein
MDGLAVARGLPPDLVDELTRVHFDGRPGLRDIGSSDSDLAHWASLKCCW